MTTQKSFQRQFVQILYSLLLQTDCCSSSGSSRGEHAGGGPGLVWLHTVCGCAAGWIYFQILRNAFETVYGRWTFNSRADIPAVSSPNARSLTACSLRVFVLCGKTAHCRVAVYCGQPGAHLCNNPNRHPDMSHLCGGWMISAGEVLTNADLDFRFLDSIWEKYVLWTERKSLNPLSSAHEKWELCSV